MATSHKYNEQFERVKRYYERFKEIDQGKPHCLPTPYYEDDVYSFFIHCHHLKDWIENDPTVSVSKQEVEDFVYANPANNALRICADICNGAKHLKRIPSKIVSGRERDIKNKAFTLNIIEGSSEPPTIAIKFAIDEGVDAFKIATECLEKWEEFIKKIVPKS
jgi:hypothetical protein